MRFTREEVSKHNTITSCWVIANGIVYDVTDFLRVTPDHVERVMEVAGLDITRDYMFHTIAQRGVWRKYRIGTLIESGCCSVC
mgnify:CR=1 FL=1